VRVPVIAAGAHQPVRFAAVTKHHAADVGPELGQRVLPSGDRVFRVYQAFRIQLAHEFKAFNHLVRIVVRYPAAVFLGITVNRKAGEERDQRGRIPVSG